MARFLLRVALIHVVLTTVAAPLGARPGRGLEAEEAQLHIGRIAAGAVATATFELHNTGDAPVRILRAAPS